MSPKKKSRKKKVKAAKKKARTTKKAPPRKKASAKKKAKAKKKTRTTKKAPPRKKASAKKKTKATKKLTRKKKVPARRKATKKKAKAKKRASPGKSARTGNKATVQKTAPAKTLTVKPAPKPAAEPVENRKTRPRRARRRSSRRASLVRRGPDGEILAPGDLLLPGGAQGTEEIEYLFRGTMAAELPAPDDAINEVLAKRGVPEGPGEREELQATVDWARQRFGAGDVEPIIPMRANLRRTFQGVVERARQRRREVGAFLRGLDMGHTETSHMDAHGEASLQSLMEWAARLENLVENLTETPEMNQGHYTQFHRVLDQLEATTEALIIDVEQTLRRLRDRHGD
jgi:hypothetical protein